MLSFHLHSVFRQFARVVILCCLLGTFYIAIDLFYGFSSLSSYYGRPLRINQNKTWAKKASNFRNESGPTSNAFIAPKFQPHARLADFDCGPFIEEEEEEEAKASAPLPDRITYRDPPHLNMTCEAVRERARFVDYVYDEERDFPIAFVRAVFMDYTFLEMELAANYVPQNQYCYVMDAKADTSFQARMRALALCFSNVHVLDATFNMSSGGKHVNQAQYACLNYLLPFRWKYVMLMETNLQMVTIFRIYNGTNDVGAINLNTLNHNRRMFALPAHFTLDRLKIFRNQTLNVKDKSLTIVKSITHCALSYAAVHYMFNLNIAILMDTMNGDNFEHESFTSTLNANELLGLPGGFTDSCINDTNIDTMTRLTHWGRAGCGSGVLRHGLCVFGLRDLGARLARAPHLCANKLMPAADFAAVGCWHARLYQQQHFARNATVDAAFYRWLPQVAWRRHRADPAAPFRCAHHAAHFLPRYAIPPIQ